MPAHVVEAENGKHDPAVENPYRIVAIPKGDFPCIQSDTENC